MAFFKGGLFPRGNLEPWEFTPCALAISLWRKLVSNEPLRGDTRVKGRGQKAMDIDWAPTMRPALTHFTLSRQPLCCDQVL